MYDTNGMIEEREREREGGRLELECRREKVEGEKRGREEKRITGSHVRWVRQAVQWVLNTSRNSMIKLY